MFDLEIWPDRNGWQWRAVTRTGRELGRGGGYVEQRTCVRAAQLFAELLGVAHGRVRRLVP